jgi:hypothetical protein
MLPVAPSAWFSLDPQEGQFLLALMYSPSCDIPY